MSIEHYLDLKQLKCPIPVLKTHIFLKKLAKGEQVRIECTDPQTLDDIPAFCQTRGYTLLETFIEHETYSFKIRV